MEYLPYSTWCYEEGYFIPIPNHFLIECCVSAPCYRGYTVRFVLVFSESVGPDVSQFFQSTKNLVFIS